VVGKTDLSRLETFTGSVEAAHNRHGGVEDGNVRMPFAGEQHGAPTVLCHAHHVAAALHEHGFQRVEENPVVVRDQDPNGTFAAAFAKTRLGDSHRALLEVRGSNWNG